MSNGLALWAEPAAVSHSARTCSDTASVVPAAHCAARAGSARLETMQTTEFWLYRRDDGTRWRQVTEVGLVLIA